MKNVKYYNKDCFEFHESVISNKKKTKLDSNFKERVSFLSTDIKQLFSSFDNDFSINSLENLKSFGYEDKNKSDLLSLYSYTNKIIQQLKSNLTTSESGRIINTCQNCTINQVNSFDHFLPKTEFPEFVVNPKNLFPSCTECNSYKSSVWRNSGERLFLNLYLDKLPDIQYLFVTIEKSKDVFKTTFCLKNTNGIDPKIFKLLEFHYEKLHLFKRFSENNDLVITPLKNSIESFLGKLPLEEIKKTIIEISEKNQNAFGFNFWKSILEISLVHNEEFMNEFKSF